MALPIPIERLWSDLQAARADVLREVEGLSQRQVDWRPAETEWSLGEIIDHLTVAEVNTGKLTSKLLKESAARGGAATFPADLTAFTPLAPLPTGGDAPEVVWPTAGKPIGELLATMKAARERSRQSLERLATCDPRALTFKHHRLGELDLAQWWMLQASHDRLHRDQMRAVKAAREFPRS